MEAAAKRVALDLFKTTALGRYARSEDLDPARVRLSIKNGESGTTKRLRVDFYRGVRLDVDALNRDLAEAEEEDRGDDQAIAEAAAGATGPASAISPGSIAGGAPSATGPSDAMSTGVSSRGDHQHTGRDASVTGAPASTSSVGGGTTTAAPYQATSYTHPRSWLHEDWSINWNLAQYRRKQQGLDGEPDHTDGDGRRSGSPAPFAEADDPLGFLGPTILDSLRRMSLRVSSAKVFRVRMEAKWEDSVGGILGLLNGLMGAPIAMKVEGVQVVAIPRETKKEKSRLGSLLGLAGTAVPATAQQPSSGGNVISWAVSGGGAADDILSSHHGGASHAGGSFVGTAHKRSASSGFLGLFGASASPAHASGSRCGASRSHHHRNVASASQHRRPRNASLPLPPASVRNRTPRIVPPSSGVPQPSSLQPKKAAASAFGLGALSGMIGREKLRARQNREVEFVLKRRRHVLERADTRRRRGEESLRRGLWGWLGASGLGDDSSGGWKFAKKEALGWRAFRRNFARRVAENVVLEVEGVNVQVVVRRPDGGGADKRKKKKKPRGNGDPVGSGWMRFGGSAGASFSGGERLMGEDGEQERQDCFTAGIVLDMFSIHDTDANGNRVYGDSDTDNSTKDFIFKSVKFSGLGLYLEEGGAEALDRAGKDEKEEAEPPPDDENESLFSESLAVSAWRKHGDGYGVPRRYVVNPLSFEAAYRQKKSKGGRVGTVDEGSSPEQCQDDPTYLLFSQMSHLSAVLSKQQLGLANEMVEALLIASSGSSSRPSHSLHLQPLFPEYRPACSITALTAGDWWKYAIRSIIRLTSRSQERGSRGRWSMWRDFMDAFRKRQRYLVLYRRHLWSERPEGKDTKAGTGADQPWGGFLSNSEQSEMHDIESDRSISIEAVLQWRSQAELDVCHENAKRGKFEGDGSSDKTKLGVTEPSSGKGILGRFRGGGLGGSSGNIGELDAEAIDPPRKEDICTLRLELEDCYSPAFSGSPTMPHQQASTAELELSVGFVVLDLVQANLSPFAKVRLGPIETSYRLGEGASLSFTLSSLQIEDQTSMGELAFPSIVRSVHHMQSTSQQDEDITIDGTVDTGISGITGNSGMSQDPAPAPAVHLALAVPSVELGEKAGTALFRTTSFEVVLSTSFLRGMMSFFSLCPVLEPSFPLSSSSHHDDEEKYGTEQLGSNSTMALYVLVRTAKQKILDRVSEAVAAAFSQVDERGRQRQKKWSVDILIGPPVLIFPPQTDDIRDPGTSSFSSMGGISSGSSSRALAVRLGQQHLVSTESSSSSLNASKREASDEISEEAGAPSVLNEWLSEIQTTGTENPTLALDRWKLDITGAAVALGPPAAGDWLRRIDEPKATLQDKDERKGRSRQGDGASGGLDVLISPFSVSTGIGTSSVTINGKGDSLCHRLVWLQCTLPSIEAICRSAAVSSSLVNVQQWKQAWDEATQLRDTGIDDMFFDDMGVDEVWEFDTSLLRDSRFFSLMATDTFPTPIHDALHLSGSLGYLFMELDGGSHGQFEVRVVDLSLSHSAGLPGVKSSKGEIHLNEFWLLHRMALSGHKLLFSPSMVTAAAPVSSSAVLNRFHSIGNKSDADDDRNIVGEDKTVPLVKGHWSISSVHGKDPASEESGGTNEGDSASLHLDIGDATVHWHTEMIESLMKIWREIAHQLDRGRASFVPDSSGGGLDLIEGEDESHSSVSTSPSLLETRVQMSWFVQWLFPIWGIVRDAIALPSPETLASVRTHLNSVSLVMHFGEDQDEQSQYLAAVAQDALCEIGVQGHNEMTILLELGKLSVERSLTYGVRSENRCLFRSIDSTTEQRFLVLTYTRQASTAADESHDPNTFRTRAITMMQILPARIVFVGEHATLLGRFMKMAGLKKLFAPSTGTVSRLLQLDTVEQEFQCTVTDLVVDIPEAAHSLSKVIIRVNDLVARHMRVPFSGGGEGKLDVRGVSAEFHDGHKLLHQPADMSIDMILSPVDDSGNHQVMKVEAYIPELAVSLMRSHYDQALSTISGNIESMATATERDIVPGHLSFNGLAEHTIREARSDEGRRVTMKLEINVNTEHISLDLHNDSEAGGPVANIRCEGGNILLQSIPANGYFQLDGNAESIFIENGSTSEKSTSLPILSQLDSRESSRDGGRMLLVHYEQNSDNTTEFSIIFGDCQAMISRSFIDKALSFFDVPSAEYKGRRSKRGKTSEEMSGSKSVVRLRTAAFRLVLAEGTEESHGRYALQGQYDADYTARRSESGSIEGVDVQANCSSMNFYKMGSDDSTELVHVLEPATLSVMASSTHSETKIDQEIKVIALTPITLNLSMQDVVYLRAVCWLLSDISSKVIGGNMFASNVIHTEKSTGDQDAVSDLDQSFALNKTSSSTAADAALSELDFLSEHKEVPESKDEEVQKLQPRLNPLPMSTQLSLILPNMTIVIVDNSSGARSLFKMVAENIFCDGQLTSRSEGDGYSSMLYPAVFQLRFSLDSEVFDAASSQWKDFVSRCDASLSLKQEERLHVENGARYTVRSKVEIQPFTLSLSDVAVGHLDCIARTPLFASSPPLDHSSLVMAEGRGSRQWADRFDGDMVIFGAHIPCCDISVIDSSSPETGIVVATLRWEDTRLEHVHMLSTPETEDKPQEHCSNSRFVVTVRTMQAIAGDGSSIAAECCPYGSDALKVVIFSQRRASSKEVSVDDAEIIIASTDPVNHVSVNTTDSFIMKLADSFDNFLQIVSAPLPAKKKDARKEKHEDSELYHVKRMHVNPVQFTLNIKPDGRYSGRGKDSPLFNYLKDLSRSSEKDKEVCLSELAVENVTGARFVAWAFLYREYASRLKAANVPDSAEFTEEDLLQERHVDIPTVVFVDDAESSSKIENATAMEEFKHALKQLDDQSAVPVCTNGESLGKEEAKPLQKLGNMFGMGSFRNPKR